MPYILFNTHRAGLRLTTRTMVVASTKLLLVAANRNQLHQKNSLVTFLSPQHDLRAPPSFFFFPFVFYKMDINHLLNTFDFKASQCIIIIIISFFSNTVNQRDCKFTRTDSWGCSLIRYAKGFLSSFLLFSWRPSHPGPKHLTFSDFSNTPVSTCSH